MRTSFRAGLLHAKPTTGASAHPSYSFKRKISQTCGIVTLCFAGAAKFENDFLMDLEAIPVLRFMVLLPFWLENRLNQ